MRRALCVVALLGAVTASAQQPPFKWAPPGPVQYKIYTPTGTPGYTTPTPVFSAAQLTTATDAAWAEWAGATGCTTWLRGSNTGPTTATSSTNQISEMPIVISSAADPYYQYALGNGTAASASLPLTYAGQIYACDIVINAYDFGYSTTTTTPPGALDLQSRIAYELGHCFGFADSTYPTSDVMNGQIAPGPSSRKPALTGQDSQLMCSYYAALSYGAPCTTTCNGGYTCTAVPPATSPKFCTIGCQVPAAGGANPCGPPFVCVSSTRFPGFSGMCAPGPIAVTTVGNACTPGTMSTDCQNPAATCITPVPPQPPPASQTTFWPAGYCSQNCGQGGTACPTGSTCYGIGGTTRACLKDCHVGEAECREGYACSPLNATDTGACVTACQVDADCGPTGYCRSCDGVCFAGGKAKVEIGDECTLDTDCGAGQNCLASRVCSQPCHLTCGACPLGSSCQPLTAPYGNGELFCMRDCQDGTCGPRQQCGHLGTNGRGCVQACGNSAQCPSGYVCDLSSGVGQCTNSSGPTPPCVLCFVPPTDSPPSAAGVDGGVGGVTSGGCGCQGTAGLAGFAPALLLGLALLGRRRRCQLP